MSERAEEWDGWDVETSTAWIRTERIGKPREQPLAQCYFCGEKSVILSFGDIAHRRADVRALDAVDAGTTEPPESFKMIDINNISRAAEDKQDVQTLRRRLDREPGIRYLA